MISCVFTIAPSEWILNDLFILVNCRLNSVKVSDSKLIAINRNCYLFTKLRPAFILAKLFKKDGQKGRNWCMREIVWSSLKCLQNVKLKDGNIFGKSKWTWKKKVKERKNIFFALFWSSIRSVNHIYGDCQNWQTAQKLWQQSMKR